MLAQKAEFINQSMSDGDMLEMDEIDDFVLSAKESMALATGNPLIIKKVEIDEEVKRLQILQKAHLSELYSMQDRLARLPGEIEALEKRRRSITADIDNVEANITNTDEFMTVGGRMYSRKDAAAAFDGALKKVKGGTAATVGKYRGLDLVYYDKFSIEGAKGTVTLNGKSSYSIDLGSSLEGNITRIANEATRLTSYLDNVSTRIEKLKSESESITADTSKPFKYQKELETALKEQSDINAKLNIGEKDDMSDVITEDMNDELADEREQVDEAESSEYSLSDDGGNKPADLRMKTFADIAAIVSRVSTVNGVEWFDDSPDVGMVSGRGNGFSEQVDKWLRGEMESSEYFELGSTPEVLQMLGAKNLPMVMTKEVIAKITGEKHSIALDEIMNLPEMIADPILVLKSSTYPNAFVVLTEIGDKNGNDALVIIHLTKIENRLKVNRIASVYGKNNISKYI